MVSARVKSGIAVAAKFGVAIFVAVGSWFASYYAGVRALKVTAVHSTASIMRNVEITLTLEFRVPEQYLEQGYRTARAMDVDLRDLNDTKRIMPYIHSFIDTWFSDFGTIRCCTGIFVDYDWTYLQNHGDSYNNTNAFALVNVMLGDGAHYWEPKGSAGSTYITQGFKVDDTLHPDNATKYDVGFMNWTPIFRRSDAAEGFHYALQIGYNGQGSPDRAWWSPIYRYDIKKPFALKAECGIPLFYPYGSNNKIGMWVIGFQVAWISYFLKDLVSTLPAGTFIFLTEHKTGKFVSSSDNAITGLQPDESLGDGEWPFVATRCEQAKVRDAAKAAVDRWGSFDAIPKLSRADDPEVMEVAIDGEFRYVYIKPFTHREMQWLIFVTIPESSILEDIRAARAVTLPISLLLGASSFWAKFFVGFVSEKLNLKEKVVAKLGRGGTGPDMGDGDHETMAQVVKDVARMSVRDVVQLDHV